MKTFAEETQDFQRVLLLEALTLYKWNKAKTCRQLGLTRKQIYRFMAELNIEEPIKQPKEVKPKRQYHRSWINMGKAR